MQVVRLVLDGHLIEERKMQRTPMKDEIIWMTSDEFYK